MVPDRSAAAAVVALLAARSLTVATAESLTAGLVSARIADVPGASAVLRGGVVAYATQVKADVLGVDAGIELPADTRADMVVDTLLG